VQPLGLCDRRISRLERQTLRLWGCGSSGCELSLASVWEPLCYSGTGSSALASIALDPDFVMPLPRAAITRTTNRDYLVVLRPSAVRLPPNFPTVFTDRLRIACRFREILRSRSGSKHAC
jgi:hypothetical protein